VCGISDSGDKFLQLVVEEAVVLLGVEGELGFFELRQPLPERLHEVSMVVGAVLLLPRRDAHRLPGWVGRI